MLHLMAYCNFQSEENESDDAFYVDVTTLYTIVGNYKCVTFDGKKCIRWFENLMSINCVPHL